VHGFADHEEKWAAAVADVKGVEAEGATVSVDAGARRSMTCTSARYAEYLADVVRRAIALQQASTGRAAPRSEYML
jgi:hypothetical protein